MSLSFLTPAALQREAERQRHMARRAADCPIGYTRDAWARRCMEQARECERRAASEARTN